MSIENINLTAFKKQPAVYYFESNNEIIYVGSSKNLCKRMTEHRNHIKKGSNGGHQQDFYQFLKDNPFTIHFAYCDDYRELEQQLIEKNNPKYNCRRAFTGIAFNGNMAEYQKKYNVSHKEEIKQYKKQYQNQLCSYNGETLTLNALRCRFQRKGISNPTQEAKKYLITETQGGNQ